MPAAQLCFLVSLPASCASDDGDGVLGSNFALKNEDVNGTVCLLFSFYICFLRRIEVFYLETNGSVVQFTIR